MRESDVHESADGARETLAQALIRAGQQDRAALRQVYALTSAKLFGICFRICGDRESAEDVLQDVYVKVWRRAGQFDAQRASPITWLATIAPNSAIDWQRASGRAILVPEEAAADVADDRLAADEQMMAAQGRARIFECLEQLDGRTARSIRAAFFDGATYLDLAERAAVPLGTM
ncbi:MAG: sigma-70 family RNA polymerase sigma factor, partial [bacterium]|nr:sigma-70 family RNA polymerase sigma factor [bacterium]